MRHVLIKNILADDSVAPCGGKVTAGFFEISPETHTNFSAELDVACSCMASQDLRTMLELL
jgi:hypothetical protein